MATGNAALANAILDGLEPTLSGATMSFRSGSAPGASNAATGTVLAQLTLPPDPFADAASGLKAKAGLWFVSAIAASGTVGHWRLVCTGGAVLEGSVSIVGGGGEVQIDNGLGTLVLTSGGGAGFQVTAFTLRTPFV